MTLQKLLLINYRNIAYQEIVLSPSWNLFYGGNAQGKTNILESIYLTAKGRSFKSGTDRDLIRFGQRSAYVCSELMRKKRKKQVEVKISMVDRKRVRINEVEVENWKELSDQFEVVLFAPESIALVQGGPAERRYFLDDLLKNKEARYGSCLQAYEKILAQRNALLKSPKDAWFDRQLDILDHQLAETGFQLLSGRQKILSELSPLAEQAMERMSGQKETVTLSYFSSAPPAQEIENPQALEQLLLDRRAEDQNQGFTGIGPHKDDLLLSVNGLSSRKFASQGQARSLTLALKLAEMKLVERYKGLRPLLLLDDVFSELDEERIRFLLAEISDYQAVLTANHLPLEAQQQGAVFQVKGGRISVSS